MKKNSLESVSKKIIAFNKARGWLPTPQDIAKSIVIEAAELLEKFQWDDSDKYNQNKVSKNWDEIGEEVADVFWYIISFCHASNIDLIEVISDKFDKNEKKYPEKMFNGKHNDKFYKAQKRKYREARKK